MSTSSNKTELTDTGRIRWCDGLKGVACLFVLLEHYNNAFPGLLHRVPEALHNLLISGDLMVYVFFLVSAFLASWLQMKNPSPKTVARRSIGRYFRLAFPMFCLCAFVFCLYHLGLFGHYNTATALSGGGESFSTYNDESMSAKQLLVFPFAKGLIQSSHQFSFVLWVMPYLFIGFLISMAWTSVISSVKKSLAVPLCVAVTLAVAKWLDTKWALFFIAPLLVWLQQESQQWKLESKWVCTCVSIILCIPIVVMGLEWIQGGMLALIGAVELVGACIIGPHAESILDSRPLKKLGKLSFGVYLFHQPLLPSLCSWLYVGLVGQGIDLLPVELLILAALMAATWLIAEAFSRWVEPQLGRATNWLLDRIVPSDAS